MNFFSSPKRPSPKYTFNFSKKVVKKVRRQANFLLKKFDSLGEINRIFSGQNNKTYVVHCFFILLFFLFTFYSISSLYISWTFHDMRFISPRKSYFFYQKRRFYYRKSPLQPFYSETVYFITNFKNFKTVKATKWLKKLLKNLF